MTEFTVTGIRYQFPAELTYEERTEAAKQYVASLQKGTPVVLVAEPENPMDANAIAVYIDYERMGYIDKEETHVVRTLLDENQQCDALVERNDGHITLFVTIPGAAEKAHVMNSRPRILPASPLGEEVRMPFTKAESTLQLVATRLLKTELKQENLQELLKLSARYVSLLKLSICHDDCIWLNSIRKKLDKVELLSKEWAMTKEEAELLSDVYKKVRACAGDMHRTSDHWPERVFKQHLNTIRGDKAITGHLFNKYCQTFLSGKDFAEADKQRMNLELERLRLWLQEMPWSELRNPEDLDAMALKVNYLGLSRTELYDLFSVNLLVEKLDEILDGGSFSMEEVTGQLLPIFYNDRVAVRDFLSNCLKMKSTQITDMVNRLVKDRVISDQSKGRDLWQVLHDYGIYTKTESNWNMRVK
ncbi:MAG: HIRAN domain-containing protein [Bacteroidaceae bacterium]|nr:HIRAN domain-containing protein [Bacteroidaceae bacterium]